ncbi:unnamed protein product [Rhizophagus irregularis]|nr:unnamed protein product [Rhizophagus irregularis]
MLNRPAFMTNPDNHLERIAVVQRSNTIGRATMDEVVNILCKLSILHCKVLFGEAERFEEWLKEKGIKDKII